MRGPPPFDSLVAPAAIVLTVSAMLTTPNAPWVCGPLLLGLGLVGTAWAPAATLGVIVAWTAGVRGPCGAGVLGVALCLGALRWSWSATAAVAITVLVGVKQEVAAQVLPAAASVVPLWMVTGVVAACAGAAVGRGGWGASAPPSRALGWAVLVSGVITFGRLGGLGGLEGAERLALATRLGAATWVYDDLVRSSRVGASTPKRERLLLDLVRAAPQRDEAALVLGADRALDVGWRPSRVCRPSVGDGLDACGPERTEVIAVAMELERRGRGGEALRLLAHQPRVGRVDWTMALLEAAQGRVSGWRGGLDPAAGHLPGSIPWAAELVVDSEISREILVEAPLSALVVEATGAEYEGAPSLEVRVDGRSVGRWVLGGDPKVRFLVGVGPHRLALRFDNDRSGPGGDRNVLLTGVRGE